MKFELTRNGMVVTTTFAPVSITSILTFVATYARVPSLVIAIPRGPTSTGMVAITVFVPRSITEKELPFWLVTYTSEPSGVIASPEGATPTGIVATMVLLAVLITDTVLLTLPAPFAT